MKIIQFLGFEMFCMILNDLEEIIYDPFMTSKNSQKIMTMITKNHLRPSAKSKKV